VSRSELKIIAHQNNRWRLACDTAVDLWCSSAEYQHDQAANDVSLERLQLFLTNHTIASVYATFVRIWYLRVKINGASTKYRKGNSKMSVKRSSAAKRSKNLLVIYQGM